MRTMNFFRFLSKDHNVDIIYSTGLDKEKEVSIFRKEYLISKKTNYNFFTKFQYKINKFINFRPWIVDSFEDGYKNKVKNIILNNDYELIVVRYIHNFYPLLFLKQSKKNNIVLDCDDILGEPLCDICNSQKNEFISNLRTKLDLFLLNKYRQKCFRMSVPIFCSEEDRRVMIQDPSSQSFVVPNTYPINMERAEIKSSGYSNFLDLLFVGSLNYLPNIDGLKYFILNFVPALKNKYSNFVFNIVGRNPSSSFVDFCSKFEYINLYSNAETLNAYYESCFAVVVPLLSGGGTRIKILESALCKRPVISTHVGAYGLAYSLKNNVFLYNKLDEFVNSVEFLRNKNCYDEVVMNAYDSVRKNYSQSTFNDSLKLVSQSMRVKNSYE